jgi:hypothetical protein
MQSLYDILEITDISTIVPIHSQILEFDTNWTSKTFTDRFSGKDPVLLIAQNVQTKENAGYMVGYDRYNDGSYYCWMTGVVPNHRRNG